MLSPISRAVDQIFEKVDGNRDGKITKNELTDALETAGNETAASEQSTNVEQIFKLLDSAGKGYLTKQDVASAVESSPEPPPQKARPGGAGPPPGGGDDGGSTQSSSATDPADTNGDGTVSVQEEVAYALQQYSKAAQETAYAGTALYG